jgi:hypothetical protein
MVFIAQAYLTMLILSGRAGIQLTMVFSSRTKKLGNGCAYPLIFGRPLLR